MPAHALTGIARIKAIIKISAVLLHALFKIEPPLLFR
jgi:hypothetical protein